MSIPKDVWLAVGFGFVCGACSLIVPGPDDFTYDLDDAGVDGSLGADGGVDGGADGGPDAAPPLDAGCPETCGGECTDTRTDPLHCGSCALTCTAPANGSATCVDAICGFACDPGYARVLGTCVEREAPRPIAPLSTATVTSLRPTLRWELAPRSDGARIELCEDRACTSVLQTIDAPGTSARPLTDLPAGVVFWRLFSLDAGAPSIVPSFTWQMTVGARRADIAETSWGTTLDVNGDGFADLAIGAPGAGSFDGVVYVHLGGPIGLSATADQTLDGPAGAGGRFGGSVASAGDVDGDGFSDLVVGASTTNSAYMYLGGPSGLAPAPVSLASPDGRLGSFGYSVASAGDVNGDGYADVVIGAYGVSAGDGAAYVYHGGATGLAMVPQTLDAVTTGGAFGSSVASAGDVNGDGLSDLLIGAWGVRLYDGEAYLYLGNAGGLAAAPTTTLAGPPGETGRFGIRVACAGDLDGDGFADLAVGALGVSANDGAVYTYRGRGGTGGLAATPVATLAGPTGVAGMFALVAGAGDVDGDGYADLVVGAPEEANPTGGAAYLYRGGAGGLSTTRETIVRPAGGGGWFGDAVAGLGDVDGDGFGDVAVAAPRAAARDGKVFVFMGSSAGLTSSPSTFAGGVGTGERLGSAVASAEIQSGSHRRERPGDAPRRGPDRRCIFAVVEAHTRQPVPV